MNKKLENKIPVDTFKGTEINLKFVCEKVNEIIDKVNKQTDVIKELIINPKTQASPRWKDKCKCGNMKTKEATTCYGCYLKKMQGSDYGDIVEYSDIIKLKKKHLSKKVK